MPFEVQLSDAARADLVSVREWLSQPGSGPRAAHRLAAIRAAILDLAVSPTRWPIGEHVGTRARNVAEHRIIYRVAEGEMPGTGSVDVLRVFGPRQSRDSL